MRPRKLEHQALPGRWAAITRVLIRITRRSELAGNLLRAALLCAPRRLCLRYAPTRAAPRRAAPPALTRATAPLYRRGRPTTTRTPRRTRCTHLMQVSRAQNCKCKRCGATSFGPPATSCWRREVLCEFRTSAPRSQRATRHATQRVRSSTPSRSSSRRRRRRGCQRQRVNRRRRRRRGCQRQRTSRRRRRRQQ